MIRVLLFIMIGFILCPSIFGQNTPQLKVTSNATTVSAAKKDELSKTKSNLSNPPTNEILLDYNNMSLFVKSRVDQNKKNGRPLYEGLGKKYVIEIPEISDKKMMEKRLLFLKSWNGCYSYEYLSEKKVTIVISIEKKSEDLKEKLSTNFNSFDFISETIIVK